MDKIDQIYAFLAVNEDVEGIVLFQTGSMHLPMVGANIARVDLLRRVAQDISNDTGKKISICKFSQRELIEIIKPK